MILLYSAQVCPFAQRPRALLTHLGEPFELREIDLGARDPEFLARTPTGRVPLLVEGTLALYESQVIADYLAETRGFTAAYSADAGLRARQRLAMKRWDEAVGPAFYRSLRDPAALSDDDTRALSRELDEIAETVAAAGAPTADLLAFHCAPFWARMTWLREHAPLPAQVDAREPLRAWLDAAVALPAIQATLPDRDATVQRYRERFVGTSR